MTSEGSPGVPLQGQGVRGPSTGVRHYGYIEVRVCGFGAPQLRGSWQHLGQHRGYTVVRYSLFM